MWKLFIESYANVSYLIVLLLVFIIRDTSHHGILLAFAVGFTTLVGLFDITRAPLSQGSGSADRQAAGTMWLLIVRTDTDQYNTMGATTEQQPSSSDPVSTVGDQMRIRPRFVGDFCAVLES